MRGRILGFVERLRADDVVVSVGETMDALEAVGVAGVERPILREALAATLVKREDDRATFDRLFDEAFPLVAAAGRTRKRARRGGGDEPSVGGHGRGEGAGGRPSEAPPEEPSMAGRARSRAGSPRATGEPTGRRTTRATARRALVRMPFHELGPREVEELRELVRELATRLRGRLARRERRFAHGRLDIRRTLRAAAASGGVPLRLVRRSRRPDRPDLLALVDLSGSVATASELCLALVAPAAAYFRRVRTYAFVDRLCPVTIEHGHLTPDGSLDLWARSDFGRVLEELDTDQARLLGRHTLLLIVGDARNNRRPPRADLLRRVRDRVRQLVWLVPEPRARWNTGDSVLARYAPACDAVLEVESMAALLSALRRTL